MKKVQFTSQAEMLFKPRPYKCMYGGRGGAKSWDMARALLVLGSYRKLFIVCGRETQKSIAESVHKLLSDQVATLCFFDEQPMSDFYRVLNNEIIGLNGTRFVFEGLKNNIGKLKSMEAIDILWVTEARPIMKSVWEVLLPTVRRDPPFGPFGKGSEVWIDFNPELDDDDTYVMWVLDQDPDIAKAYVNWRDNPWFPEILRKQKDKMQKNDYDNYLTVWEGKCRRTLAGAIYAKELSAAILDGRVNPNVNFIRAKPIDLVFDLGRADMTDIWFMQQQGTDHVAGDFYENCGYGFDHYIEEIQSRRYIIGRVYLPHDAKVKHISAKSSVWKQAKEAWPGEGRVIVVPNVGIANGINATRQLFPRLHFHEVKCREGIKRLQHYKYGVNPDTQKRTKEPLHDDASHAADSLRYYSVMHSQLGRAAIKEAIGEEISDNRHGYVGTEGWMQ